MEDSVVRSFKNKIDQAQRLQYWMFDVGRSMFDVLLSLDHILSVIHCSGLVDFKLVCFSTRNSDQERLTSYKRSTYFLLDLGGGFDFPPHLTNPGIEFLADLIHIIQNFYGPGLILLVRADTFDGCGKVGKIRLKAIQYCLCKAF